MKIRIAPLWIVALAIAGVCHAASGDVVLTTRNLRLAISDDAMLKSLRAEPAGAEYAWLDQPLPVAVLYRGGQSFPYATWEVCTETEARGYRGGEVVAASDVKLDGDRLTIGFAKANVTAAYEVIQHRDYLAFRLTLVEGGPVDRIDLQLGVRKLPYLGTWVNAAYDDCFGVCLCAGNIETDAGMNQHADHVIMRTIAQREVALEGATTVLFGFARDPAVAQADPVRKFLDPTSEFLDVMEIVERDFHLPSGAKNRREPIQRESYFWPAGVSPKTVDRLIEHAKQGGFRILMLSYIDFSTGAGHFAWNADYPRGMDDLKMVTDRIRAAGLKVGLHLHYNKAGRADAYLAPVPDERLNKLRRFTLLEPIDATGDTLTVAEDPQGCTLSDDMRILQIGKELISYDGYTDHAPYRFTGCQRGYLGTTASEHARDVEVALLDMDGPRFARFDQRTDITDETAERIAAIYRQTGPYPFVYFDGTEDVHAPFWHNISNAQYRVYRRLEPEPAACEAAINMHFGWHMNTRSNAYDVFRDAKNVTRQLPFRSAPMRLVDFTRLQFGWQALSEPDSVEYSMACASAWDCPASIHGLLNHPRTDCLAVTKVWEDARLGNHLGDAQRAMLRTLDPAVYRFMCCGVQQHRNDIEFVGRGLTADQLRNLCQIGQEHHLFINERGEYELVPYAPIGEVADGAVRAYGFRRPSQPEDTYQPVEQVVFCIFT